MQPLTPGLEGQPATTSRARKNRSQGTRRFLAQLLVLAWALLLGGVVHGAERVAKEYNLKAAYLCKFAQFAEWPREAFAQRDSPIILGVVGENPFGPLLEENIKGEQISNRSLVVKHFKPGEEPSGCHVLFISRSEQERLGKIIESLKHKPVLTIGEQDRFGQRGGMINFVMQETLRFEINREAVEAAGLKLSSKLLNLALPSKGEKSPEAR